MPFVSCAFRGCNWTGGGCSTDAAYRDDCEHPWDQQFKEHVLHAHADQIFEALKPMVAHCQTQELMWDVYKGALSAQERRCFPIAGFSVERRVFEYIAHVYNDERIRSLICFACAQIKVDTGRIRSAIEFRSGRWLFCLPRGSLIKNFAMGEFTKRYRAPGLPWLRLAAHGLLQNARTSLTGKSGCTLSV